VPAFRKIYFAFRDVDTLPHAAKRFLDYLVYR